MIIEDSDNMARIDINSVDLESLNDRMKKIKSKISEAQDVLNGSFANEKALKLYTEGFRKLNAFFNNTDIVYFSIITCFCIVFLYKEYYNNNNCNNNQ